jgi:hypothetical protein
MGGYAYGQRWDVVVSAGIDQAFAFLADPRSRAALESPSTDTRFVPGPPRDLGLGSEWEYIFRWWGFPVYLRLRVTEFDPPTRLVLDQVMGPWQSYRSALTLRRVGGGTRIAGQDDFSGGPGVFDHLVHRLVAARQVRAITRFRRDSLLRRLGDPTALDAVVRTADS